MRHAFMQMDFGKELRLGFSLALNNVGPGAAAECIRDAILRLDLDGVKRYTALVAELFHICGCSAEWIRSTCVAQTR